MSPTPYYADIVQPVDVDQIEAQRRSSSDALIQLCASLRTLIEPQ